jgi:FG-GAP-like repeat/FG-GAP repeat
MTCSPTLQCHHLRILRPKIANLFALLAFSLIASAQNPVPTVNQPLVPAAAVPGGTGFTLTVNGTGFVPDSVIHWNGAALNTHFVDQGRLTTLIPEANVANAGTASIDVVNPAPGGGSSQTVFFPISRPESAVAFVRSDFGAAGTNIYMVTADFNRDGKLDLAVTENFAGDVRILLGDGNGAFDSFQTYPACAAHGLTSGDLNGDGIGDLAIADLGCNGEVSVLLGNGDGTFKDGGTLNTAGVPYSITFGDFNSDGKLDVATADHLEDVSILLGNGDGSFQSYVTYPSGFDTRQVAVGDFNNDGRLDLAISSGEGVSILFGNGDGTFQPQLLYSLTTNDNPYLILADLNGDGRLDMVIANTGGSVSIMLGNGDGTFRPPAFYPTDGFSATVIAADFNGDGILDLACGNYYSANVAILLGNGDGSFHAPTNYAAASGARGLVAADFNGDGRLDLAVANQFEDSISIFLQPVIDTTPPLITLAISRATLWPPNGKMVPVEVSGRITDTGSGVDVSSVAYSVMDEYAEVQPTGAISLGAGGTYSFPVWLQESRLSTDLDGRQYTITVRASDNAGNGGSEASVLTVPHDQR